MLGDGKYSSDKVYVRSSDHDRAIMSAAANLLGLFPMEYDPNDAFRQRPIPIHTVPSDLDHIVSLERPCKQYDETLNNIKKSPEFLACETKVDRYFKLIMDNSGLENFTMSDAYTVWDALQVQHFENLT